MIDVATSRAPNSVHLATATGDHIYVWNTVQSCLSADIALQSNTSVNAITFSPSGHHIAYGSRAVHRVSIVHVNLKQEKTKHAATGPGKDQCSLVGHNGPISSLVFVDAGNRLLTGSSDTTCRLWDVERKQVISNYTGHVQRVTDVVRVDGLGQHGCVISSSSDGNCLVWDLRSCAMVQRLHGPHTGCISSITPFPGAAAFCSAGDDGRCCVWDLR